MYVTKHRLSQTFIWTKCFKGVKKCRSFKSRGQLCIEYWKDWSCFACSVTTNKQSETPGSCWRMLFCHYFMFHRLRENNQKWNEEIIVSWCTKRKEGSAWCWQSFLVFFLVVFLFSRICSAVRGAWAATVWLSSDLLNWWPSCEPMVTPEWPALLCPKHRPPLKPTAMFPNSVARIPSLAVFVCCWNNAPQWWTH